MAECARALKDFDTAIAAQPENPQFYRGRSLGRDVLAVRDFDEALRERPELVYAFRARALSYERLGQAEKAAADHKLAERRTRWADAWMRPGNTIAQFSAVATLAAD